MKMRAKPPPPYSTLNPDTSLDSPSAKSKDIRLVSATAETTQKNIIRGEKKNNGNNLHN